MILALVVGCGSSSETAESESFVGLVSTSDNTVRIAVTGISTQNRIPDVVEGLKPKDFHWVMLSLDTSKLDEARSVKGLSANLADTSGTFTFAQVYLGTCNPAKDDFGNCFLYEELASGAPGVSGNVHVRISGSKVDAEYDVVSEGLTDRFGEPIQWHKHGSIGGISAVVGGL